MPKSLLNRTKLDSIREFRAAAAVRFRDGEALASHGRRTAAIYLWGYSAEMTLKAAYFAAVGYSETRVITKNDLYGAVNAAIKSYHVAWTNRNLHEVRAWANLLVEFRSRSPAIPYALPDFGNEVKRMGRRIEPLWSETLRYRKIVAHPSEVERMRQASGWLLANSLDL
jgi:hypothetical protein